MIIPGDYRMRMAEFARRCLDDIVECSDADISVVELYGVPMLRLVFGDQRLNSLPMFRIQLVAESRSQPLAPGRLLLEADETKRYIRSAVERYFRLGGLELTRKAMNHACV